MALRKVARCSPLHCAYWARSVAPKVSQESRIFDWYHSEDHPLISNTESSRGHGGISMRRRIVGRRATDPFDFPA